MERKKYFDYMRVFATLSVIMLHICAYKWYEVEISSSTWFVIDFYNSIVRWCIPAFIMISGALFLGREIDIKTIYSKYIFRIITAFIFWTLLYAAFSQENLMGKIKQILQGYYHMWFLFLIVGMYVSIPVFNCIVKNEKLMNYYLAVTFVFSFVFPSITQLVNDFGPYILQRGMESINTDITNMSVQSFMGFGFYYVLGFYLDNKIKESRIYRIMILLGSAGALLTVVLSYIATQYNGVPKSSYYNSFSINVLMYSVGAFAWFKQKYSFVGDRKIDTVIEKLAKYSFGIYLVHVLIIEQLELRLGINAITINPIICIPVLTLLVFTISTFISVVINRIPFINKYIV